MFDDSVRNVIAGGVLLGAAALAFVAGDTADVVTTDPSNTPLPQPVAQCNPGWDNVSTRSEHTVNFVCKRGDWLVVLKADGSFSHGWQDNTPGAQHLFDPAVIPGWFQ